jgi:hypothetical protein
LTWSVLKPSRKLFKAESRLETLDMMGGERFDPCECNPVPRGIEDGSSIVYT